MVDRPSRRKKRLSLLIEALERRSLPSTVTVALNPLVDQFGVQIPTVQSYEGSPRVAYGILDTGASPITFSATDQANFEAEDSPIPLLDVGAQAGGVGGSIQGNVSQPGTIIVGGSQSSTPSNPTPSNPTNPSPTNPSPTNPSTSPTPTSPTYPSSTYPSSTYPSSAYPSSTSSNQQGTTVAAGASTPGIQAFVGTQSGSSSLPTVTGTAMFNPSSTNPLGLAAQVNLAGSNGQPAVQFVSPTTTLSAQQGTRAPVTIPLTLFGPDNYPDPGSQVTVSPNPVDTSVTISYSRYALHRKEFLFDTGSQVTIISPALARSLHLNLARPTTSITVQGAGGTVTIPGFTLTALSVPIKGGGTLRFTHVPVYVLNIGSGLDGVLGMNLFNHSASMLYNPYARGGATLSMTFFTNPGQDSAARPGGIVNPTSNIFLGALLGAFRSFTPVQSAAPIMGPTAPSPEMATPDVYMLLGINFFNTNADDAGASGSEAGPTEAGPTSTTTTVSLTAAPTFSGTSYLFVAATGQALPPAQVGTVADVQPAALTGNRATVGAQGFAVTGNQQNEPAAERNLPGDACQREQSLSASPAQERDASAPPSSVELGIRIEDVTSFFATAGQETDPQETLVTETLPAGDSLAKMAVVVAGAWGAIYAREPAARQLGRARSVILPRS